MQKHGVIPDTHVKPGCGFQRFEWLANYFVEEQPTHIIQLGDHWDLPSLCMHEMEYADFYLRSYKKDIESGHAAWDLFDNILAKRAPYYSPKKVQLGGNHDEGRITKLLLKDQRFMDLVAVDDLTRVGWKYVPFLETINIEGVHYCHYFVSGLMGRPISGENPATTLLKQKMVSCVAGHSHLYDYSERTRGDGRKILGLVAGCFLEPGQVEHYAGPSQHLWRGGVSMLHGVRDGVYDLEFLSTNRLKREFS
jgi:hypothetical protein